MNTTNDMETLLRDKDAMANAALGTDIKICHYCQKTSDEKLPTCSRCKLVGYCNRECQSEDWPKHRLECKLYKDTKKVNTSAREVFSKSKFESLRSTFVVTAYPFEHLDQVLPPGAANDLRANFSKQHPLDKDSGGCIWFARPDHWKGEYNTNSINILRYTSAKLSTTPGIEKGVAEIVYIRDMLMSQRLSLNGTYQIPIPLAHLANDKNWNALANSSDFANIVKDAPFGVMVRNIDNDKPDSETAMVTLFVNTKVMKTFVKDADNEMDKQFKEVIEVKGENPLEFAHAKLIEHYKEFDVKFAFAQAMLQAMKRKRMNMKK